MIEFTEIDTGQPGASVVEFIGYLYSEAFDY
jgi:hypothetical protein